MSDIKYIFEPEKGKLYDFFAVLNLSTRCERIEDIFGSIGLKVHRDISAAYSRIFSYIKKNSHTLKLFFNTGGKGESFFFNLFSDDLANADSIDDILNKFNSFTPSEIAVKVLSFYDSKNVFSDTFYRLTIQNRQLLIEF
mgnify:FL=1